MTCDCIKKMDAKLAYMNTRVSVVYGIDDAMNLTHTATKVVTEKVDKGIKGAKPQSLVATFCPFCGTKLVPWPSQR